MPRTLGELTIELPESWQDHSICRLTEPMPDEPFERYEIDGAERAAINPSRRSIWSCWVDCPEDLASDALQQQKSLFEHGYLLVSEHVPDRPDISEVTKLATPTYLHPEYGEVGAIHIRCSVQGKHIDEIHCYLPDESRQRVLVIVYSFPSPDPDGPGHFERLLRSSRIRPASTSELASRWGE